MNQAMLPLYDRVIFVDWHNVLSTETFWSSILGRPRHPMRRSLEAALTRVFRHPGDVADEWMRGYRSSDDVIATLSLTLGRRYNDDYLERRLRQDCRRLEPRGAAATTLRRFAESAFVVLATDNMDCFSRAVQPPLSVSGRRLALEGSFWDDVLCSSDLGVLKAEDPIRFFGGWLRVHGLGFENALLIDDRSDNCAVFERSGGSTVCWHLERDSAATLEAQIRHWLNSGHWLNSAPTPSPGEQLSWCI